MIATTGTGQPAGDQIVEENEVNWLEWVCAAKRLTGSDFPFSNRDATGAPL